MATPEDLINLAREAYNRSEYQKTCELSVRAIEALEALASLDDCLFACGYEVWARSLFVMEQYNEALERAKRAVEYAEKSSHTSALILAYELLTFILLKRGDLEAAGEAERRADKEFGNLINQAQELNYQGKYQKACEIAARTVKALDLSAVRDSRVLVYVHAYRGWAYALCEMKRYNEALDKVQKAIEYAEKSSHAPTLVMAYELLVLILLKKGDLEGADEAEGWVDKEFGNLLSLAEEAFNQGKYQTTCEVAASTVEALDLSALRDSRVLIHVRAYMIWVYALCEMKRYGEALDKMQKAVEYAEEAGDVTVSAIAYNRLADLLLRMGDIKRAKDVAERATQEADKTADHVIRADAYYCFAETLRLVNDLEQAKEAAERATQEADETDDHWIRAFTYLCLADTLLLMGHLNRAEDAARRAVKEAESKTNAHQTCSGANRALANILLVMGNLRGAEDAARRAVKEAERAGDSLTCANANIALADILLRTNQLEEAQGATTKAVEEAEKTKDPLTCSTAHFCAATVLEFVEGQKEGALERWESGVYHTLRFRRSLVGSSFEESAFAMHRRNIELAVFRMEQIAASYTESGQHGEALDAYIRAFLCAEALHGRHILEDLDHYSVETPVDFETRSILWNRLPPPGRFETDPDDLGPESNRWSASLLCLGTTTRSDESTDQAHVEPAKRGLGETGKRVDKMLRQMPSQEEIVSALPPGAVAILFAPSGNDVSVYAVRRGEDDALELVGRKPLRLEGVMRPLVDKLNELYAKIQLEFWNEQMGSVQKEKDSSRSEGLLKSYLKSLGEYMDSSGEYLYNELLGLADLPDEVWEGSDLVLIPDGLLYHVPWNLLRDRDTGEYLWEKFESVSVISNLRLLNLCEQFISASPNGDLPNPLRALVFTAADPGEGHSSEAREELKSTGARLASGMGESLGWDAVRHAWAASDAEATLGPEAKWKDFLQYHPVSAQVLIFFGHGNPGQIAWSDELVGKEKVLGSACDLSGTQVAQFCACSAGQPETGQEVRSLATAFLSKGLGCAMYGIYNLHADATAVLMRVWNEKLRDALEKDIPFPRARSFKQALEEVRREAMQTDDPDRLESFLSHPILFAPLFIFGRG